MDAGERIGNLPAGMVVRDLPTHTDDRGTVCELFDPRWAVDPDPLVFAYVFTVRPGAAKGWGIHRHHDDRYAFLAGELEVALYDERPDSETRGSMALPLRAAAAALCDSAWSLARGEEHRSAGRGRRELSDDPVRACEPR